MPGLNSVLQLHRGEEKFHSDAISGCSGKEIDGLESLGIEQRCITRKFGQLQPLPQSGPFPLCPTLASMQILNPVSF